MTNSPAIVTKKKVTENAVAKSLAAWLTSDLLSGKFENYGGIMPPSPHHPFLIPCKAHARESYNDLKLHAKVAKTK